jgi:hypothetical protein
MEELGTRLVTMKVCSASKGVEDEGKDVNRYHADGILE